jgi:hypothetical protein
MSLGSFPWLGVLRCHAFEAKLTVLLFRPDSFFSFSFEPQRLVYQDGLKVPGPGAYD